ncbi:MAG TPA: XrtN system VIT domain-containing protein [Flavisolibacter sp.]|nr:XrtN system VIT domain-containing protein [Flavisolibacter sp.]
MTSLKILLKDKRILAGWIAIALSALVFCLPLFTGIDPDGFGLIAFHFGLAVTYLFSKLIFRGAKQEVGLIHYQFIKLILFLISAYALNREMEVFAASPVWLSVILVLGCLSFLAAPLLHLAPAFARFIFFAVYGLVFTIFLYLAISLLPLYAFSAFAIIGLGFSVHSFIPLLFTIAIPILVRRLVVNNREYWGFGLGIAGALLVCIIFVAGWSKRLNEINDRYAKAMVEYDSQLPIWVQVAQVLDKDRTTEKILKTGLVYKVPSDDINFLWRMPNRNFGEEQLLHDPLVVLAHVLCGEVRLPEADRIKVLRSLYNARHQALDRLWSGDHLSTSQVATRVNVWPEMHLSYTEKIITVSNHQAKRAWPIEEEAIYTLHMPEGAVVTSLSLWIDGREEKGILTTKEKAEQAYTTIVGRERRDPSVIHWQEGNSVSVRVFPVIAGGSRMFRIGITAPLRKQGSRLSYDNIWFEGPDAGNARETVRLEMIGSAESFIRQASFAPEGSQVFTRTGSYMPRWDLQFNDPGMKPHAFSFDGYSYVMKPYFKQRSPVVFKNVFLDVNSSWTIKEWNDVWNALEGRDVWIYDRELRKVNRKADKDALFNQLHRQRFSLFPFHLVGDRESSLVITKSDAYSPNLSDLEGSGFMLSMQQMDNDLPVMVFHLGHDFSPYLRSLKEFRLFRFEFGDSRMLGDIMKKNEFAKNDETDDDLVIHSAELMISRRPGSLQTSAPDHLMRLFAYNSIMRKTGSAGLRRDSTVNLDLVETAKQAYVVSPVSSLIVLETQRDYDRFDIKASENSLRNASIQNKGAVPEPGEWALIIMAGLMLIFFVYKWKLN